MKIFHCLAACFLLFPDCNAQSVRPPFRHIYTGIGAYGKSTSDAFSFTANQASLAKMTAVSGGIYSERPYMLKELGIHYGAFVFPGKKGAWGLATNFSGGPYWQYIQCGLAYGKKLSPVMDLGVQINFNGVGITGYGRSQTLSGEIGMLVQLSDQLVTGIHIANIARASLKKTAGDWPALIYTMGIGYETSGKLLMKCDISKEEGVPVLLTPGIQYTLNKQAYIKIGMITQSGTFMAGSGLAWKNIRVDLSASYHPQLGFTPALLIILTSPHS